MKKKSIISKLSLVLGICVGVSSYTVRADEGDKAFTKPELSVSSNDEDNSIALNWDMGSLKNKYSYMIYSKDSKEVEFQSIPAKATAKVLNIYPNAGNNLKTWMETNGYGKGLISVDEVSVNAFNGNPVAYLKDGNGNWKYDVIMFGSWDANNEVNLNDNAVNVISQFVDTGRGILGGHDTIGYIWGTNKGLGRIRDKFNIKVGHWDSADAVSDEGYNYYGGFRSNKVILRKKGLLTNYPWTLGEVGTVFSVPDSHSTSNFALGDIWMTYPDDAIMSGSTFPASLNKNANFYLTTWNNTAMIQTGHSSGAATPDEQKILANTLFYLSQVTEETSWVDHKGQDLTAPKKIENLKVLKNEDGKIDISFDKAIDLGNTYEYYVEATERTTGNKLKSDTKAVTLTSGIKGYSILVDENPKGVPDGKITTTENKYTLNKNFDGDFYVHVAAVDNAGNVSEVTTYKCDYPKLDLAVSTVDKTNNSVTISAKATSSEIGIKLIKLPNGEVVEGDNAKYVAYENGVYSFIAVDNEGREIKNTVNINNITTSKILNIQQPISNVAVGDEVYAYLVIDNIDHIKSEEATIKYDATRLQFLGMQCESGVRFIRTSKKVGEIKVTLSSKGDSNIATGYKKLLKLKFKGKDTGNALVYVSGGKISNGVDMERDLLKEECGSKIIAIGLKDALSDIDNGLATVEEYKLFGIKGVNSSNIIYINQALKGKGYTKIDQINKFIKESLVDYVISGKGILEDYKLLNLKNVTSENYKWLSEELAKGIFVDIKATSVEEKLTELQKVIDKNLETYGLSKYKFNGHVYARVDEIVASWHIAKEKCEKLGGHLVTITSQEEQTFIQNYVVAKGCYYSYAIGMFKQNGKWVNITGEELKYINWHPGEPNNVGNCEDYGEIYPNGYWNDIPDGLRPNDSGYIVEWE